MSAARLPLVRRRPLASVDDTDFSKDMLPLLQRIYRARNLLNDSDTTHSLQALLAPDKLSDIDDAVAALHNCLQNESLILVVGDFDADGATSCALAVRALRAFGHRNVQFLVPNRFEYGYGLTPPIVDIAARQKPSLIVTVDNGISSIDGVARARETGIDVLVTDHHLPGRELPAAVAIVNPNNPGCEFESKALAGVGVIFYLMAALRTKLVESGWFEQRGLPVPVMADYLDLVALGTVADVVPLDRNNRILVEQGLKRIRTGRCCAGIRALLRVAGRSAAQITSSDIGFALGPRLNAAGRLDDISIGIGMLITDDESLALEIATELDALNRDRRQIEAAMHSEAERNMQALLNEEQGETQPESVPTAICLYDENWHQGVVGILASRLKERYHRPVVCFAPASDNSNEEFLKGSARSIQGFHIRDAFDLLATRQPGLIEKFGGHAMAAGLSIHRDSFGEFARGMNNIASELLGEQDLQAVLYTDGELEAGEMNLVHAEALRLAQPWGQKLPEPMFEGIFNLVSQKLVGQNHLKMRLEKTEEGARPIDAIAFNIDLALWPDNSARQVRVVYSLDVNEYRGAREVQLIVRYLERAG